MAASSTVSEKAYICTLATKSAGPTPTHSYISTTSPVPIPKMLIYHLDEQAEKDRMDIYHTMLLTARHQELHRAPIRQLQPGSNDPCRFLDGGAGTGIWAIDMAE